jgi:hypothetical protein
VNAPRSHLFERDNKFLYAAVADTDADIILLAGLFR